ncbi:MAG TPA: hypothetical protein IAC03_01050 [Candidatus Coprenecus pullistercoris]|nr:hypothetical protein [Candidatus Coprenecus pullistercoris]
MENNTADRQRIGLIGNPIGHSLSPALFREYFADRPDILSRWNYDLIERDNFSDAYAAFLRDFIAVNVTAPFKEEAFRAADVRDRSAGLCQASNLLVKSRFTVCDSISGADSQSLTGLNGGHECIVAYNTDYEAVMKILRDEFPGPASRIRVLVLGCGGAGKAAAAAAYMAGMQVCICNRTISRAQDFASHLRSFSRHIPDTRSERPGNVTAIRLADMVSAIMDSDVLINALPGPGSEEILRSFPGGQPDIFADKLIIEASYKSPCLDRVLCRRYISGLVWLRLQALATYRIVLGPDII